MFFVFFFHLLFYIIMKFHKSNFFSLIILTNKKKERPKKSGIFGCIETSSWIVQLLQTLWTDNFMIWVRIHKFVSIYFKYWTYARVIFLYKLSFYFIYFSFLARTIIVLLSLLKVWQYIVIARVLWSMPFIFLDIQ